MTEEGEPDDLLGWQEAGYEIAKLIIETPSRFLTLPSKFHVHDWQIMEDFANSVRKESVREELLSAIRGRGAFWYFKDVIHRRGVQEEWYAFRREALREIAVEWLEENGLSYAEA
jgi:hypothetical protein